MEHYQRKSIKTESATRWWETTTSPIWSYRRKAAPLGGGADAQSVSARTPARPVQCPASVGKTLDISADLNEQAADRLACIVSQMQEAEGVTED